MDRSGKVWGLLLVCSKLKQFNRALPENLVHRGLHKETASMEIGAGSRTGTNLLNAPSLNLHYHALLEQCKSSLVME